MVVVKKRAIFTRKKFSRRHNQTPSCLDSREHIVEGLLVGGNIPDMVVAHELTDNIVGCYVVEDKGYDSNKN